MCQYFHVVGSLTLPQDSNKSFFIYANGNPADGFSFQGSSVVTNLSNFQTINLVNQYTANQFCLKAMVGSNSKVLMLQSTVCYEQNGAICRKGPSILPPCNNTPRQMKGVINILSDPILTNQFNVASKSIQTQIQGLFQKINKTSGFEGMFSLLWSSGLPCFDINGVTSLQDGEKSLLKSCLWKGLKIPCAAIFNTFPSDQGMCCSFNMKAADEIFQQVTYSKLVMKKQREDKMASFMEHNVPSWYAKDGEPTIQPGINKGLTIILDGHNDIITTGSIYSDFQGFTAIVTSKDSYPLTSQKGFRLKPGHINLIGLSGTKISADEDILSIESKKRNCLFPQENDNMKIHKNYSLSNCLLECSIFYAQDMLTKSLNLSKPCSPWYYPISEPIGTVCDPWEAAEFNNYFNRVPDDRCSYCLPDCDTVIYTPTITATPFRRCDFRNLGVSSLCTLEDPFLPEPRIWAQEVLHELTIENISNPAFLQRVQLTPTERYYPTHELPFNAFNPANETYDAYEKDIAIVQFYFLTSSVIEFKTSQSQSWIDYLSAVGGLLGLCIGLSIVTIVELFWLCLRILSKLFSLD